MNQNVIRNLISTLKQYLQPSSINTHEVLTPDNKEEVLKLGHTTIEALHQLQIDLPITDWRIKTHESFIQKINKYLNYDNPVPISVAVNDLLACRIITDEYSEVYEALFSDLTLVIHSDHGYRAIHGYIGDSSHLPIEVQFHTAHDHTFNMWNREYVYKKDETYGEDLREAYELGKIKTLSDYVTMYNNYYLNTGA